jgi:glycosyltransferase involved in cell wall biosynthesis
MHVNIATPMYGGNCKGQYMDSVFNLSFALLMKGHTVSFGRVYNESLITRARNALVNEFMTNEETDVLLFIDADIQFDPSQVLRMLEQEDVELIGGVYPIKSINWTQIRNAVLTGEDNFERYTGRFTVNGMPRGVEIDLNAPVEVDQVATGMMMVRRSVFEKMMPSTGTYAKNLPNGEFDREQPIYDFFRTDIDEHGILLSEDYYFCDKWKKLGGKVYAAPWINMIHYGDYGFAGSLAEDMILNNKIATIQQSQQDSLPSSDATDDHSE